MEIVPEVIWLHLSHIILLIEGKKIHSQFLMYPMCDPNCDSESHKIFGDKYFLTNQAMKWFWKHLQKDEIDMTDEMFNLLLIIKK